MDSDLDLGNFCIFWEVSNARIKYEKRADLTPYVRTKIALIAQYGNAYGRITRSLLGSVFETSPCF